MPAATTTAYRAAFAGLSAGSGHSWLCSFDQLTGRSCEDRRPWLADRMNELAWIFAVSVLACTAMLNHLHLALELSPTCAEGGSDQYSAKR